MNELLKHINYSYVKDSQYLIHSGILYSINMSPPNVSNQPGQIIPAMNITNMTNLFKQAYPGRFLPPVWSFRYENKLLGIFTNE